MSERKPTAYEQDELTQHIERRRAALRSPSKPLTPTELDELRAEWERRLTLAPNRADELTPRLLATLDATQAVEPGLREALKRASFGLRGIAAFSPVHEKQAIIEEARRLADEADAALAARSSSAPAELEALRELSDAASEGPWHPYYTVHGDPYVVTDRVAPWSSIVATVSTEPQDYGKANAAFIVAAVNYVRSRLTSSPEVPDQHPQDPPEHPDDARMRLEDRDG